MALTAAEVLSLPDIACIGVVTKVGDAYLSAKGEYHVCSIEIKAKFAGRDGVTFFVFEPRWFGASFSPKSLLKEPNGEKKYGMYGRNVFHAKNPTTLTNLLGEDFEAFATEFDSKDDPEPTDISDNLRKYAVGREVGYIMSQRKDENGELVEQYSIKGFFPLNEEGLLEQQKQAANANRKTKLVVTWDE